MLEGHTTIATLCIIGTGHAHLNLLESIDVMVARGHEVVVVNPYPHLYYSGMAPLFVGGGCSVPEMAIPTLAIAASKGAKIIEGTVRAIDADNRTITVGNSIMQHYDVLSINIGSVTTYDGLVGKDDQSLYRTVFPVKPIRDFLSLKDVVVELVHQRFSESVWAGGARNNEGTVGDAIGGGTPRDIRIAMVGGGASNTVDDGAGRDIRIAVVGGGAAGFEVSANVRVLIDDVVRKALVGARYAEAQQAGVDTTALASSTSSTISSASSSKLSATSRNGRVHRRYRLSHPYCSITLFTGGNPLSDFPKRLQRLSMRRAGAMGITIVDTRVSSVENGCEVVLDGGVRHNFDVIVLATGVTVPPLIASSSIPSADRGQMKVNSFLQSVQYPNIFGGGDCIATEPLLPNLGVFAIRQGPILAHNVQAFLNGDAAAMQPFVPQPHVFFALNMGNRRGVATKYRVVWQGKTPYWLKLKFDTLFIDKYTAGRHKENH